MSIQTWPSEQRPREKLLRLGARSLSDAELLAIFLRTGVKGCNVVDLSAQLLTSFGDLNSLLAASQSAFCAHLGLGQAKYVQLQAVLEMSRRYYESAIAEVPVMSHSELAKRYVQQRLVDYEQEVFACLFLNTQHELIHFAELFKGTINKAPVYPREIAKQALLHNAAAVILAHNHPSGHCQPSKADELITDDIVKALSLLDVKVLDHLIVARRGVFSFAQEHML